MLPISVRPVNYPVQSYNNFMDSQRHSSANVQPGTPSSGFHGDDFNGKIENRSRGWSDTSPNGRGRGYNRFHNYGNHQNGRRLPPINPRGTPPRHPVSGEPVYVLTDQRSPPNDPTPSGPHRIVSEPVPSSNFSHHQGNMLKKSPTN